MRERLVRRLTPALAASACVALAACPAKDAPPRDTARETAVAEVEGAVKGCPGSTGANASGGDSVVVHQVNRGTHGMMARTRWIASPDGCALLVVEDPAAVEAEPVTNGGLLVSEREAQPTVVKIDSVWDVAPDSAWRTLAFGRGWILQGGERDTVPPEKWAALARATGVDAARLEATSFNGSGMAYARGVALAYVQPLDGGAGRQIGAGGWRVRWRGDTLFAGSAPQNVQDHAEPTRWTMHTAPGWEPVTVPATFAPPPQRWAEGPTIDIGTEADSTLAALRMLDLSHGRAAQSRGWQVYLLEPGKPPRAVGPGALLAATLGGRFLLALAPAPGAKEYDPKVRLVVYEVR
jgi:hypothetical protein